MNNTMIAVASIFTGKGGTLKLAIVGSLLAAIAYEIMDSQYGVNVKTKDSSISFSPASKPVDEAVGTTEEAFDTGEDVNSTEEV